MDTGGCPWGALGVPLGCPWGALGVPNVNNFCQILSGSDAHEKPGVAPPWAPSDTHKHPHTQAFPYINSSYPSGTLKHVISGAYVCQCGAWSLGILMGAHVVLSHQSLQPTLAHINNTYDINNLCMSQVVLMCAEVARYLLLGYSLYITVGLWAAYPLLYCLSLLVCRQLHSIKIILALSANQSILTLKRYGHHSNIEGHATAYRLLQPRSEVVLTAHRGNTETQPTAAVAVLKGLGGASTQPV